MDVAARTGGDEFAVLMPDGDAAGRQSGSPTACARRSRQSDAADRGRYGLPPALELTVSVGVAAASARDAERLMEAADKALYVAKREGRNRVVVRRLRRAAPARHPC